MRLVATLALSILAAPAFAECPTAADLDGGIRFEDSGGETETFTNGRRDRLNSYVAYLDGNGTGYVTLHGHYSVQLTDFENGKPLPGGPHVRHTYTPRPPAPRPNMTWVGVSDSRDGGDRYTTQETHVMGALRTFKIGACTYNSFPITVTFVEADYTEYETSEYLVDLGIGLLVRRWDKDGKDDRYRYMNATAVK